MSLVGLRYSSEFLVPPGAPTFLQRLPEETRPHKPACTVLWAGRTHRGRPGEKEKNCSYRFWRYIVPMKTRMQTNGKQNDRVKLCFKMESFWSQKQNCHYYCELVLSLEIRGSVPPANAGRGPSKMLFNQIIHLPASWGCAYRCLFGWKWGTGETSSCLRRP